MGARSNILVAYFASASAGTRKDRNNDMKLRDAIEHELQCAENRLDTAEQVAHQYSVALVAVPTKFIEDINKQIILLKCEVAEYKNMLSANTHYQYWVSGSSASGNSWEVRGSVDSNSLLVYEDASRESFNKLTNGNAVYGKPGLGCFGPYKINKVTIERVEQ